MLVPKPAIQGQDHETASPSDRNPDPDGKPHPRPAGRNGPKSDKGFLRLRMHHLLFLAFTLVTGTPIAMLAIWEARASVQNEVASVNVRHLLVARTLASTMSRYVRDLKSTFSIALDGGVLAAPPPGLSDLLLSLDVVHVSVLAPNGSVEKRLRSLPEGDALVPDARLVNELRALPPVGSADPVLSNLYHDAKGNPVFYMLKLLPNGRLGLGIVRTNYLIALQQTVRFGDRGHAVITDAKGQVIAHPLLDWVAASRDLSGVNVVAAMMRGESNVGQFWSPAFQDTMIAGYAVVPETQWGVMVPQPMGELYAHANQITQIAAVVGSIAFGAAALLSWLLALYLTSPVRAVASTAEAVLDGNDEVSVPPFRGWVPFEVRRLGGAVNLMLADLRQKAKETAEALHQAETSSQAKTQFLANMSHEIRTPLNGVVGMVELLQMTELTVPQRRYIDQATQSAQTLLRVVDDILDLSRIEAGGLALEEAPFHLAGLMQDVRMLFSEQVKTKGLRLITSVPESLNGVFLGDKHRLLQILTNLIANAIKFTDQGQISVGVAPVEERGNSLRLRFEVADTGMGIPADKQRIIFQAFSQADVSMTRRFGGTGLGLAIARQLSHVMGGQIGVDSKLGVGSTFWFTVLLDRHPDAAELQLDLDIDSPAGDAVADPVPPRPALPIMAVPPDEPAPIPPAAGPPASRPPASAGRSSVSTAAGDFRAILRDAGRTSLRIMLVEDNPANMRVTQALLEILGAHVTQARNGLEAVDAYKAGTFDLVLMDCQMPEMDGYDATRAIRRHEAETGQRTPIVALTAHARAGSRETSLAAGMDDQLTKPLTMAALTAKLLEWLAHDPPLPRAIAATSG